MGCRQKSRAAYRRMAYIAISEAADLAESGSAEELTFWTAIQDLINCRYPKVEEASNWMTYNAALETFRWLK